MHHRGVIFILWLTSTGICSNLIPKGCWRELPGGYPHPSLLGTTISDPVAQEVQRQYSATICANSPSLDGIIFLPKWIDGALSNPLHGLFPVSVMMVGLSLRTGLSPSPTCLWYGPFQGPSVALGTGNMHIHSANPQSSYAALFSGNKPGKVEDS